MSLSRLSFYVLYESLQVRNLIPLAFGTAGLVMPSYVEPRAFSAVPPAGGTITEAQLQQATELVQSGRRVEAYLLLAEWTGCSVFLTTAQIASGSGAWVGGPAINVNARLELANAGVYPENGIEDFSTVVALREIAALRDPRRAVAGGGAWTLPSEFDVMQAARGAWLTAKGYPEPALQALFPGNLLLLYHYFKTGDDAAFNTLVQSMGGDTKVYDLLIKTAQAAVAEFIDSGPQFGLTRAQAQARSAQGGTVETMTVLGEALTVYKDAAGKAFAVFRALDDVPTDQLPGLGLSTVRYGSGNDPFENESNANFLFSAAVSYLGRESADKTALLAFSASTKSTNDPNFNFQRSVVQTILALHRLLVDPQAGPPAGGDTAVGMQRLIALLQVPALASSQNLTSLLGKSAADLQSLAMQNDTQGLAARYALKHLSLVALADADYGVLPSAELSQLGLAGVDNLDGLSTQWIDQRSSMLAKLIELEGKNLGSAAAVDDSRYLSNRTYIDLASGATVKTRGSAQANAGAVEAQKVVFGTDANDSILGSDADTRTEGDALFGGVGNDTLNGADGADYLEGGIGADSLIGGAGNDTLVGGRDFDTYTFAGEFGHDVVIDAGGDGRIEIGSDTLSGGNKVLANVWASADGKYVYTQTDAGLVIGRRTAPGSSTVNATITIRGWQSGQLGIQLEQAIQPPPVATTLTGDYAKQVSGSNYVLSGDNYASAGALPDSEDILIGNADGNKISGLGGNDGLYGASGADLIEGGAGNDLLLGGTGQDTLYGGEGQDIIFGSAVGGIDRPTATNFAPPVANDAVVARGFSWVATRPDVPRLDPATGTAVFRQVSVGGAVTSPGWDDGGQFYVELEGNVIDGGGGNDYIAAGTGHDTVSGGEGDDDIAGMDKDDILFGDAGNDIVYGDGMGSEADYGVHTPFDRHGADTLFGGSGNDTLAGQGGSDWIDGGADNDRIWGDDSPDNAPFAYHGDDYLDGGGGDDQLTGGGRNDTLYGGEGNDDLWGDGDGLGDASLEVQGQDILFGDAGADQLIGGGADDTLSGGIGNDVLLGDDIQSRLPTSAHGNDFLDGGDGNDLMAGNGGSDTLLGGAGNDQMQGDDLSSNVDASAHGDDYLDGGDGADTLVGGAGSDALMGGAGNDVLRGDDLPDNVPLAAHSDDLLEGGAGDDTLYGDGGNDTLVGGTGVDFLDGGFGDDVYRFTAGDNLPNALGYADAIDDAFGDNTLELAGASLASIQVMESGGSLFLHYGGEALGIAHALSGGGIATFVIDDTAYGMADLVGLRSTTTVTGVQAGGGLQVMGGNQADNLSADTGDTFFSGGQGDDTLAGSGGRNTYRYWAGGGTDTILDTSAKVDATGAPLTNRVSFGEGIHATDLKISVEPGQLRIQVGNDAANALLIAGFDATDPAAAVPVDEFAFAGGSVLSYEQLMALGLEGSQGSDALSGTAVADALRGLEGDDTLTGLSGDDTLDGGAGSDTLAGGFGSDTYVWGAGAGVDFIDDADSEAGSVDTLRITGITPTEAIVSRSDADLFVRFGTDSVTLKNSSTGTAGIERFVFDDGTVWDKATILAHVVNELTAGNDSYTASAGNDTVDGGGGNDTIRGQGGHDLLLGSAGNDSLLGGSGNDTLDGGAGNDTLEGGSGADVYLFGRGSGQDVIASITDSTAVDVLRLGRDISPDDVELTRSGWTGELKVVGTTDQIYLGPPALLQRVEFGDGTVWDTEELLQRWVLASGTEGNDTIETISGWTYDFTVDGRGGNDRIDLYGPGNHTVLGSAGNDTISSSAGNDSLDGGTGTDSLESGDGNDVLTDGETMRGGLGADTYVLSAWQSQVTIHEVAQDASVVDVLELPPGVLPGELLVERIWNSAGSGYDDLRLRRAGDSIYGPIVLIPDFFYATDADDRKIEKVRFADGTEWTAADLFARVATHQVTLGSDSILGFRGDDVIDALAGNDSVEASFGNDLLQGGAGNDRIYGDAYNTGADTRDGDDTLDGGAGNDTLLGGGGNDQYLWGRGAGADRVSEVGGVDTLSLAEGIAEADVTLWRHGDDLIVALDAGPSQLVVEGHFTGAGKQIETISFAGGESWDAAAIAARATAGTPNAMSGTAGSDTFVVDHVDDAITDTGGVDLVQSSVSYTLPYEVEDITLTGFLNIDATGNDRNNHIQGNSGNNALWGASELSMHNWNTGADTLAGGAGDDSYYLNGSTGSSDDEAVNDLVVESANAGNDTVYVWAYHYTLTANVENLVSQNVSIALSTWDDIPILCSLTGNELDNVIDFSGRRAGGALLDGGLGADTLLGGDQADTYVVDDAGDVVIDSGQVNGQGYRRPDTVRSWVTYTLPDAVENLELLGTAAIDGTGNALDNVLDGSTSSGANHLAGGLGDDTYRIGSLDTIVEAADGGNDTVVVVQGAVGGNFSVADFAGVENLVLTDVLSGAGATGDAADNVLTGNASDNMLAGGDGKDTLYDQAPTGSTADNDTLEGGAGDDTLISRNGNDLLDGGAGDDTITQSGHGTVVFGVGHGHDTVGAYGASGTRSIRFGTGVTPADLRLARSGTDLEIAIGTNDKLTLLGFYPDTGATEPAGLFAFLEFADGTRLDQSAFHAMAAGTLDLSSSGGKPLVIGSDAAQSLTGTGAASGEAFYGRGGNDSIAGGAAADLLDGGAGADAMAGGAGDDTYFVDEIADTVTETAGAGTDTIVSSVALATLAENVENLTLTGNAALALVGNALANVLTGNAGDNSFTGGGGADTMRGGLGDDSYTVDGDDTVLENAGEGVDTVTAALTWSLGSHLENLVLAGSSPIDGTGNALANAITGNAADNTLDGGAGADTLAGGAGNDTYFVDNWFDVVVEDAGAGSDGVYTSASYALGLHVENLVLTGTAAIDGWGNGLANWIEGNGADNRLDGGALGDSMLGRGGNDLYIVDDLGDLVVEAADEGADTVHSSVNYVMPDNVENLVLTGTASNATGNALANWIRGNAEDNVLDGKEGADSMLAGGGNDVYFVDDFGDWVEEYANEGTDTVYASLYYELKDNVENLVLVGTAYEGYGNAGANWMQGNAGDNRLDGRGGADMMLGGDGDDAYFVDTAADQVVEEPGQGIDTVYASASYTLGANTENIVLTGSASIDATGNELANWMVGNDGNNTLDGGAGADAMAGGAGNDAYRVDDTGDGVTEQAGGGIDTVYASLTYTLGAEVENLVLAGTSAIDGTGNGLDNWMEGNAAANRLVGGDGNDALHGHAGADTLEGGGGDDKYFMERGSGSDLLVETGTSAGDAAEFGVGIAGDQLWFTQTGDDLVVQIIGTSDVATVQDWYVRTGSERVDVFRAGGESLLAADVQNLVDAMASFQPPPAGQTTLGPEYSGLETTIAANWN